MKAIVTKANKHNVTEVFLNPDVFYKKMLFKRFFFKNAELGIQNETFISRNYGTIAVEIRIKKYFPSFHCG